MLTGFLNPEHVGRMPGSKERPQLSPETVLDEPWSNPQGTENDMKRQHRALLPPGYPEDLARDSTPETGSIGFSSMPIAHRDAPFKLKGGR